MVEFPLITRLPERLGVRRVYLDNNATTPVAPEVLEAMKPYFQDDYGNASSIHWYGQRARAAIETSREQLARLLNVRPRSRPYLTFDFHTAAGGGRLPDVPA